VAPSEAAAVAARVPRAAAAAARAEAVAVAARVAGDVAW
jgi:hypothetical protein